MVTATKGTAKTATAKTARVSDPKGRSVCAGTRMQCMVCACVCYVCVFVRTDIGSE